jgi:hypothetical protein
MPTGEGPLPMAAIMHGRASAVEPTLNVVAVPIRRADRPITTNARVSSTLHADVAGPRWRMRAAVGCRRVAASRRVSARRRVAASRRVPARRRVAASRRVPSRCRVLAACRRVSTRCRVLAACRRVSTRRRVLAARRRVLAACRRVLAARRRVRLRARS